jgi:hypothetical protein
MTHIRVFTYLFTFCCFQYIYALVYPNVNNEISSIGEYNSNFASLNQKCFFNN